MFPGLFIVMYLLTHTSYCIGRIFSGHKTSKKIRNCLFLCEFSVKIDIIQKLPIIKLQVLNERESWYIDVKNCAEVE
jgi:hypothetical protein